MKTNKKYYTAEELKNKLMKKSGFASEYQKLQPELEGMGAKPSISLLHKVAQALQTKIIVNIQ